MLPRRRVLQQSTVVGCGILSTVGTTSAGQYSHRSFQKTFESAPDENELLVDVEIAEDARLVLETIAAPESTIFTDDMTWHDDSSKIYFTSYSDEEIRDPSSEYLLESTLYAFETDQRAIQWEQTFENPIVRIESVDSEYIAILTTSTAIHVLEKDSGEIATTTKLLDTDSYPDIFDQHFTDGMTVDAFRVDTNSLLVELSVGWRDDIEKVGRIFRVDGANLEEDVQDFDEFEMSGSGYWIVRSGTTVYKYQTEPNSQELITDLPTENYLSHEGAGGIAYYQSDPDNPVVIVNPVSATATRVSHGKDHLSDLLSAEDYFVLETHNTSGTGEKPLVPEGLEAEEIQETDEIFVQAYDLGGSELIDQRVYDGETEFELNAGGGKIYIVEGDALSCRNTSTGREDWTETQVEEYSILDSGNVLIRYAGGGISLIESDSGSSLWEGEPEAETVYPGGGEFDELLAVLTGDELIFIRTADGSEVGSVDYFVDDFDLEFYPCDSETLYVADVQPGNNATVELSNGGIEVHSADDGPMCKDHAMVYHDSAGAYLIEETADPETMELKDNFVNVLGLLELDLPSPSSNGDYHSGFYETDDATLYAYSTGEHSVVADINIVDDGYEPNDQTQDGEESDTEDQPVEEASDDPDTLTETGESDSIPGFGIGAVIVGLCLVVYRLFTDSGFP